MIDDKLKIITKHISLMKQGLSFDDKLLILINMGKELVDADRCSIWTFDQEKNELVTKFAHGVDQKLHLSSDRGIVGHCFLTKETLLIDDAYNNEYFNNLIDKETGYTTKSIITMPILNNDQEVVGIFQALNKNTHVGVFGKPVGFHSEALMK